MFKHKLIISIFVCFQFVLITVTLWLVNDHTILKIQRKHVKRKKLIMFKLETPPDLLKSVHRIHGKYYDITR